MNHASKGSLVWLVLAVACVEDGPLKVPGPFVPEPLSDGWSVSTLEAHGIAPEPMKDVYDLFNDPERYRNALGLMVAHRGELVFETYSRGLGDRERLHHVQSVTKSVTSLAFGIVRAASHFPDLDAPLSSLAPNWVAQHEDKKAITIRHLLTMHSGIEFDNGVFSTDIYLGQPDDVVDAILSHPMYAAPGERFYYRDCDPHLLSALIEETTGETLESWARRDLLGPLGISLYEWGRDPDGHTMAAHGLFLRPRDMTRIGQLVLDGGMHDEEALVPADWLDESLSSQSETDDPNYDYGYYWWLVPELDAFTAWGHGGNFIFVVPREELVITMVSMPDVNDAIVGTLLPEFLVLARKVVEAAP